MRVAWENGSKVGGANITIKEDFIKKTIKDVKILLRGDSDVKHNRRKLNG